MQENRSFTIHKLDENSYSMDYLEQQLFNQEMYSYFSSKPIAKLPDSQIDILDSNFDYGLFDDGLLG